MNDDTEVPYVEIPPPLSVPRRTPAERTLVEGLVAGALVDLADRARERRDREFWTFWRKQQEFILRYGLGADTLRQELGP